MTSCGLVDDESGVEHEYVRPAKRCSYKFPERIMHVNKGLRIASWLQYQNLGRVQATVRLSRRTTWTRSEQSTCMVQTVGRSAHARYLLVCRGSDALHEYIILEHVAVKSRWPGVSIVTKSLWFLDIYQTSRHVRPAATDRHVTSRV